jgi:GNAT superfamily N-acetyltransferase
MFKDCKPKIRYRQSVLLNVLYFALCLLAVTPTLSSQQMPPLLAAEIDAEIHLMTLRGSEALLYHQELSAFYNLFYRAPPYRYVAGKNAWDQYVGSYMETSSSIFVLAIKNGAIIAAAMGTPLAEASEKYRVPFAVENADLSSSFYLGELAVKRQYQNQGLGKTLYDTFETMVREDGRFSEICLWQLASEARTPNGTFWEKRGFTLYPEIHFEELWRETPAPGAPKIPHEMVAWKKLLLENQIVKRKMPRIGLEPTYLAAPEPKSGVSTNFTTWASGL